MVKTVQGLPARVGDRIEITGHAVGDAPRNGEIIEVLGEAGHEHFRVRWEDGHESIIAVARYVRDPNPASAEFAIVVADRAQRKGLASKLMARLMTNARFAGIERLRGLVLASNDSMLELMDRLGFEAFAVDDDPSLVDVVKVL